MTASDAIQRYGAGAEVESAGGRHIVFVYYVHRDGTYRAKTIYETSAYSHAQERCDHINQAIRAVARHLAKPTE